MGKRSNFKRRKNDAYFTPYDGVPPLIPHLIKGSTFSEPCAGDGRLVRHLHRNGMSCKWQSDIAPKHNDVIRADAFKLNKELEADYIITNPVWTRELLHPMIEHFMNIAPTWLLFDASWKYTTQKYMARREGCKNVPELLKNCVKIVPVGRLKWIEGTDHKGKDDCAWYLFDKYHKNYPRFEPRGVL